MTCNAFLLPTWILIIIYAAQFLEHFSKYGEIVDYVIMKKKETVQHRGFGFVTYADPSVVDKVIKHTHIINGKQVRLFSLNIFLTDMSMGLQPSKYKEKLRKN